MSRVLIIPDVHLKPYMFDMADKLMKEHNISNAVFLGDLVDDWNKENDIDLYRNTINRAIQFKHSHPESLFCWGNHEAGYMAPWYCSGNSKLYKEEITQMIKEYDREVEPKFVHYIDNVLFSHAGLEKYSTEFTEQIMDNKSNTIEQIADTVNYHEAKDFVASRKLKA